MRAFLPLGWRGVSSRKEAESPLLARRVSRGIAGFRSLRLSNQVAHDPASS